MFKKAQAAMEFLMTYGWAILVVLAAIAALAYFGVLSPDRFLPEKCTMPSGIACLDFAVPSNTSVILSLQNAAGFDMEEISVTLKNDVGATLCTSSTPPTLANGVKASYTLTSCSLPPSGQKVKAVINMQYNNSETHLQHDKIGELIAKMP